MGEPDFTFFDDGSVLINPPKGGFKRRKGKCPICGKNSYGHSNIFGTTKCDFCKKGKLIF